MLIDFEIAFASNRHIKKAMAGKKREHMVKKSDTGRNFGFAAAVQRDGYGNIRFAGLTLDAGHSHCFCPVNDSLIC